MTVDLIPAHLEKKEKLQVNALVDLNPLSNVEIQSLLSTQVIAIPVLVRVIIALKQNHVAKVWVQYAMGQDELVKQLKNHPLLTSGVEYFCLQSAETISPDLLQRMRPSGVLWVEPAYLINCVMLETFQEYFDFRNQNHMEIFRTSVCKNNLLWLPPAFIQNLNSISLHEAIKNAGKKEIKIIASEADGVLVKDKTGIKAAEKILFADVTRKKGGYLAKRLNEPISLVIAKYCAYTPLTPNFITVINTLLGILSAWLVVWGASKYQYWPMAAGAILFYLVDIFDGIDGELARFTFRFSKNGALYDTISDNVTLLCFLLASTYAAYKQFPSPLVIAAGIATILLAASTIFYLYLFTMKHFGNASLRLYEIRFMPMIPKESALIRFVFWIRHFYTKDVLAAGLSLAILFNMPVAIMVGAPFLILLMVFGFIFMGLKYGHLLSAKSA